MFPIESLRSSIVFAYMFSFDPKEVGFFYTLHVTQIQLKERQSAICTTTFDGIGWLQLPECFASILYLLALGYLANHYGSCSHNAIQRRRANGLLLICERAMRSFPTNYLTRLTERVWCQNRVERINKLVPLNFLISSKYLVYKTAA